MKLLIFCIIVLLSQSSFADRKLVFAGIKGSLNTDISMIVLKEVYSKLGIEIELLALPAERALHTSNSGKIDGEVFRIINVDKRYNNLLMVPTSINKLQGIAFVKNKPFKVEGWQSLKPLKIGGQFGVKFVERGTKGMKRKLVDTNEQLFSMLDRGRVDVAIAAYVNGIKTIKKLQLKEIQALQPSIQDYPLYHYVHKKNSHLIPKLNDILIKMDQSGRIKQIRDDYIKNYMSSQTN